MGLYDRDYTKHNYNPYQHPQMRFTMPRLTPVVKVLLIINIAVFFVSIVIRPIGNLIYDFFAVDATTVFRAFQLWRLVSYQFLHAGAMHLLFNMLGLFFLGPTLERHFGSRKFLYFYLCCGIAGGLFYLVLAAIGVLPAAVMVGASGAILGMLAAAAILFPHFVVFILLFPVPIRLAAMMFTLIYIASVFVGSANAGGDAAHLAGMAAGAFYVWLWPRIKAYKVKSNSGNWNRKMQKRREMQEQVDRILHKVNAEGIGSLTKKEKKMLKQATELEQIRNRF